MKDYQIIYNEVLTHSFQVEANSEEEAEAKFQKMLENGELDFSYGEITDTSFEIYEDWKIGWAIRPLNEQKG